ncbi:MAG: prepilin peptidase [Rhodospirillaceae bacterium]|nr:prepilin peptidase [Rhodospirillaceae bacterium]
MLPFATVDLAALLGLVALLIAAAVSDTRRLVVPNRYCLSIALLYAVHVLAARGTVDWRGGLTVGAASLAVGFVLFLLRLFGGGDAKLFAATSLWAGPALLPELVFGTAVAGAVLAFAYLMQRRVRAVAAPAAADAAAAPQASPEPDRRWQRTLPYGVAIAAGGVEIAVMLFVGR